MAQERLLADVWYAIPRFTRGTKIAATEASRTEHYRIRSHLGRLDSVVGDAVENVSSRSLKSSEENDVRSLGLNHVAMGVPPGTLTDEYRAQVLDFYGPLLGWAEIEQLRLADRLTIRVGGSTYINLRERSDSVVVDRHQDDRYEHFGVTVGSSADFDAILACLREHGIEPEPPTDSATFRSLRFQHLLPFAVEVQWFASS